jgi:TPP-dependent pyruvate/acetoin dehydrogenase alpha subunit
MTSRAASASAPLPAPGTSTSPPAGLLAPQLLEIYRYLVLTRTLEERLVLLCRQNKLVGGLFRSLGQEGEAVASAYALDRGRKRDLLSPLIRNLGSMLVMGAEPLEILRQYQAKAAAPSGGRDLNLHFGDLERGFLGQISHLGDMVAVMAGVALSFKLRGERRVALVYIGDGATSTGACHEGLNFAAVQRVPLVVIGEYNRWAYATPPEKQFAIRNLAERAAGYGIPAVTVDGNDVLAVYEATKRAVECARGGDGAQFVEVRTYRRSGHAEHDDQHYVPQSELAQARADDPIERYRSQLLAERWADAAALRALDRRVQAEVDEAAACVHEPGPSAASALGGVYAVPAAVEPAWYRRL